MKNSRVSVLVLPGVIAAVTMFSSCVTQQKPSSEAKGGGGEFTVTRYSERPMSEYQTKVMNEATTLSLACRMFRDLYGRWPNNLFELQCRTEGIDYSIFIGKASIKPNSDDTAIISIFDGVDYRETTAVPVSFNYSAEERAEAIKPKYRIKLK